jgi:hypothetical protein
MKKILALVPLVFAVTLIGCSHPQPYYGPPPPPPPGLNYQAIEQQGQHDGFDAARHDVQTGRPPVFSDHPRYRNPPVPPPAFGSYRQGFRVGYEQFLHQSPPPPGQ